MPRSTQGSSRGPVAAWATLTRVQGPPSARPPSGSGQSTDPDTEISGMSGGPADPGSGAPPSADACTGDCPAGEPRSASAPAVPGTSAAWTAARVPPPGRPAAAVPSAPARLLLLSLASV